MHALLACMTAVLVANCAEMHPCGWQGFASLHRASDLTIDDLRAAPTLDLQGSLRLSTAILLHA